MLNTKKVVAVFFVKQAEKEATNPAKRKKIVDSKSKLKLNRLRPKAPSVVVCLFSNRS
jgi:hypothetical protein